MSTKSSSSISDWAGIVIFVGVFGLMAYLEFGSAINAWAERTMAGDGLSPLGIAALVITAVAIAVVFNVVRDGSRTLESSTPTNVTAGKGNGVGRRHHHTLRLATTMKTGDKR